MSVNAVIRGAFRCFGLDVRFVRNLERNKYEEAIKAWKKQWSILQPLGIRTVLDIGANEGQFAEMIRGVVPDAAVISFEPLPSCYEKLQTVIYRIRNSKCMNVGIGDVNEKSEMFRSSSSPSSSLLSMSRIHMKEWPETSQNTPVSVTLRRLDDVVNPADLQKPLAVKIDVQGFEDKVIKGGEKTLRHADLVVIETSFTPLYEGQPLFEDIYELMKALGFSYRGALSTLKSKEDNIILQEDSLYTVDTK